MSTSLQLNNTSLAIIEIGMDYATILVPGPNSQICPAEEVDRVGHVSHVPFLKEKSRFRHGEPRDFG